tara:strand:+ start:3099 stop:3854 length:756 start_codon:yes stop_codon:yes gene_type:complete
MKKPKVLVCSPQHESKMYCWEDWVKNVKNFTYPNFDVYLADNSETDNNVNIIKSEGFFADHTPRKHEKLLFHINDSHNQCRDFLLKNNYDYMFHLETDLFPPIDVIERLMFHDRDVISGTYDIFHGEERKLMIQEDEEYDKSIRSYRKISYAEERESLFYNGKINKVYHAGIGCVLIKKHVIEKIPFRIVDNTMFHSDTWFSTDLSNLDIPYFVDSTIMCKHKNFTWLTKFDKSYNYDEIFDDNIKKGVKI